MEFRKPTAAMSRPSPKTTRARREPLATRPAPNKMTQNTVRGPPLRTSSRRLWTSVSSTALPPHGVHLQAPAPSVPSVPSVPSAPSVISVISVLFVLFVLFVRSASPTQTTPTQSLPSPKTTNPPQSLNSIHAHRNPSLPALTKRQTPQPTLAVLGKSQMNSGGKLWPPTDHAGMCLNSRRGASLFGRTTQALAPLGQA